MPQSAAERPNYQAVQRSRKFEVSFLIGRVESDPPEKLRRKFGFPEPSAVPTTILRLTLTGLFVESTAQRQYVDYAQ